MTKTKAVAPPRISQRELASELGLSVATINRALCNHVGTNPETRARVIEAAARKGYRYWDRSREMETLKADALAGDAPCPFGDGMWQLWVNHTLVHAEARHRALQEATFAVCASRNNEALLKGGQTLNTFRSLLTNPASMKFISVEDLLNALEESIGPGQFWQDWISYLKGRYCVL